MEKVVIDTSVILKWYLQEAGTFKAKQIYKDFQNQKIQIILPELIKYELGNALLKGKKLDSNKVKQPLANFYRLPLIFVALDNQLAFLTYQIAEQLKITFYDACFLALAKREKAVLITANPKHQQKAKGIKIKQL